MKFLFKSNEALKEQLKTVTSSLEIVEENLSKLSQNENIHSNTILSRNREIEVLQKKQKQNKNALF